MLASGETSRARRIANRSRSPVHPFLAAELARFDLERSLERGVRGLWPGSAAFPKYGRNLNMGGDNNRDSTYATAHQRILHDRARPSFVTMPVIPR